MISFDSVTKKFSTKTSGIQDVSFTIDDNEFVFIVGASGAGKTTILRLIMGELAPSSGNITINDWNITRKSFKELHLLRRDIGIVFQDFKLLPYKNVLENIALSMHTREPRPLSEFLRMVLLYLSASKSNEVEPSDPESND